MLNFQTLRDKFGSNPFASDLQNGFLIETTKPYSKGSQLNYQGINYTVQTDIAAKKPVLLILDGQIAIGEATAPVENLNERVVLDRRATQETRVELSKIPWLWSVSFIPETKAYVTSYPNNRRDSIDVYDQTNSTISSNVDSWFVWTSKDNTIYTLGFSNDFTTSGGGQPIIAKRWVNGQEDLNIDLNSSLSRTNGSESALSTNDWLWVPGHNSFLYGNAFVNNNALVFWKTDDPSRLNNVGFTTLFSKQEFERPLTVNTMVSNYQNDLYPNNLTGVNFEGTVCLFPGETKSIDFIWQSYFWENNVEGALNGVDGKDRATDRYFYWVDDRAFKGTFIKPRMVDSQDNRAVIFEAINYERVNKRRFNYSDLFPFTTECYEWKISYDDLGYFYYDYENNIRTPINSFGPNFIPIKSSTVQSLKEEYAEGDTIQILYDSTDFTPGFHSDFGHYQPELNSFSEPITEKGSLFCSRCQSSGWQGWPDPDSAREETCINGSPQCPAGESLILDGPGESKGAQYWITAKFYVEEKEGPYVGKEEYQELILTQFSDSSDIYGPVTLIGVVTEQVNGRLTDRLKFTAYKSQADGENEINPQDLFFDPWTKASFLFDEVQQSVTINSYKDVMYRVAGNYFDIPSSEKNYRCSGGTAPTCGIGDGDVPPSCEPVGFAAFTAQLKITLERRTSDFSRGSRYIRFINGARRWYTNNPSIPTLQFFEPTDKVDQPPGDPPPTPIQYKVYDSISWVTTGRGSFNIGFGDRWSDPNSPPNSAPLAYFEGGNRNIHANDSSAPSGLTTSTTSPPYHVEIPITTLTLTLFNDPNNTPSGYPPGLLDDQIYEVEVLDSDFLYTPPNTDLTNADYCPQNPTQAEPNPGTPPERLRDSYPENLPRQDQFNYWTQSTEVPFRAWGYVPTLDGKLALVLGEVITFNYSEETEKALIKPYSLQKTFYPEVFPRRVQNVSFRIDKIYGYIPANNINPLYLKKEASPELSNSVYEGYLHFGTSINNATYSGFDNPEALISIPTETIVDPYKDRVRIPVTGRQDPEDIVEYGADTTRYIWENLSSSENKDFFWMYPTNFKEYLSEENPILFAPRFKFEKQNDRYEVIFQSFDEINLTEELDIKDISFHYTDKGRRRPRV